MRLAPPTYGILFKSTSSPVFQISGNFDNGSSKGLTQIIDHRQEILPNAMHNHQGIAYSPVATLPPKLVEDIVVVMHERLGFGRVWVLEKPRPLKETD